MDSSTSSSGKLHTPNSSGELLVGRGKEKEKKAGAGAVRLPTVGYVDTHPTDSEYYVTFNSNSIPT